MTKMTKLWGALALIFAAATTWGTPVQVWNGDFETDSTGAYTKTVGGVTYTLTLNGNEVKTGTDGKKYIEITNSNAGSLGVSVERSSNTSGNGGTVLVKYSNLVSTGYEPNVILASLYENTKMDSGYPVIAGLQLSNAQGTPSIFWAEGYWNNKEKNGGDGSALTMGAETTGYLAFSYNSTGGSIAYRGAEDGIWTKIFAQSGSLGSDTYGIIGFGVGGLYAELGRTGTFKNNARPATGMKIHAIAFADAGITDASGLGGFAFYDGELVKITVDSNNATSQIAELDSLTDDSHVEITINSGAKLTLDETIPGHVMVLGDGTLYVPSGTSATLKNAAVSTTVLVEGTLTTEGVVSMTGSNKFDTGSILSVSDGVTTISKTRNGNNSYGDTRGLMGTITIEKDATLALNCGDAINYSADASHKTEINVKGTLDCGNKRQSFKANNIVNLYVGGTITGTGDGNAALDFTADNNQDAIHVLDYADVATKTATISAVMRGNAASRPIAIDVPEGVELTVSGVIKQGKITKAGAGTLTLSATNTYAGGTDVNAGTVKTSVVANLADKTFSVGDGAVLEFANDGDKSGFDSNDLSHITGNGAIKFSGSGYLAIPTDSSNKLWASTLEVINDLSSAILMKEATTYTIGSLSGSGMFRYDWGDNLRTLVVKQSKNTTWSGGVFNSAGHTDSRYSRSLNLNVQSKNESILTVSGTPSCATTKLTLGTGATVKITGSCAGIGVVLDGGKLQSTGSDGAHGTMVKNLALNQDGSYEWVAGSDSQIGIGANNQSSTLALNNHTLTLTGKGTDRYDRVYLDKTTISSAGTIEVTKGHLFLHCGSITAPAGTKIIIGSNASIACDNQTLSVPELEYNGTQTVESADMCMVTVTSKLSGTGSIPKLTLANGVEVRGQVTVQNEAVLSDTIRLMEEGATLKVPAAVEGWETKVLSGLDTKNVAYDEGTKTFSLVNKPSPSVVTVTINGETTGYATIEAAIEAAAGVEGAVITLADGAAVPAGFVKAEDSNVITAAKYIVISPSSYVENWKAYVTARKASPVADGITFGVKNADEIYAAYPANATADDGTPRNDAESIHKWIGLMQKLGTKYFVLGGRWKGIDTSTKAYNPQTDRATIIPGVAVYPKLPKADASPLDIVSSDLFYACHYKADGQKYVWDPSNDGVYVGLMETAADQMDDVRHFQPNCVVSRMDLYGNLKNTTARNYQQCIADYKTKIVNAETQAFSGSDRYVAWTSQCKSFDASGLPDVYGVMSARLNSINTARGAKELLHLIYLGIEPTEENGYQTQAMSAELLAENKASLLNGNWEVFLPFGHGTPDGFAGLDTEAFGTNSGLAKFFMGNIPCLTGSQTAECNAASAALANPNGGALVSVNNSSYGYLTEAGITKRYSGLSDELADHCLDTYVGGATAGESWRNAISVFAGKVLSTEGFKNDALVARGHDGCSTVTLHSGKANEVELTVPDKNYVIAAMIEENLFGDPLVKIQTTSKSTSIAATASRLARDYGVCADEFANALAEFNKDDSKSLTVTGACTTESAITVPEGRTLEVLNETTLTAQSVTVNGTLVGAGTVNAAITFGANSTLDVSRLAKLTIPAGKDVTLPQAGINFIVPEGTTKIPAVLSLLVCNRADEGDHRALVKSVTAKGSESALTPCGTAFKLEALNGKIYLVDEGNMIEVPHFLTDLGATVATITIEDKEGNKRELELARDPKNPEVILDHYLVPAGSKVVITITPDAEHSGDNQTARINSAADLSAIKGELKAYTTERTASTVFYNAGTGVEYSGVMANKVVNAEGHNSQILDGDTVVFDRNHAVPTDIVVGADPKGAKLVFEKDVTLTTEQTTPLFTGKAFEIHADHVLTFMPGTTEGFKLGNCTMDKGTAVFAAGGQNNENNIFYLDSIVGTTLLDFRPEVEIRSLNSDNWIHFHTRVTGGATVTGNVRILGDARVIVKRSEYITVTGDVTAQVVDAAGKPVAGEYHRLTIDAMDAMVEWDDNGTPKPVNLLKLKDKATADAIVGRINLIAPEVKDENGELILWQLDTLNDGMIVMTRLEYDVRDGFFMNGILGKDEYADWKYNSAFDQSVTKIQATCPAELKFDFTGAAEGAVITVDKPIELSGTGKLTFDVPEGKTVIVTGTISGTEGVRKSGKGTLIFAGDADNTFEGSLVVSEGAVRTTKAHGYSMHRTLSDGTVENPEIDVHTGATLDVGNVCDRDNLTIISAGTITNSVHGASQIGKIKTLTLKGDTTVCGHTFGMAKDSKIVLEGHKLTIAMERGECVTTPKPDGTGTEVHDHEFELNNTQVSGGKDNLATPDIIVRQGTLSCEGSTYVDDVFTKGVNNLGNASLKICEDAAIRLDTDLIVKRIQIVDAMKKVVVPCNVNPDGTPAAPHTHEFEKIWEESVGGGHYGKIIIRQELVGGIKAPRLQLGLESDTSKMLYDVGNNMNSPDIRRIRLGDGEYIDCTEEFIFGIGYPFNAFFEDWTGEAGARRLFHGWSKFADGYSSAEIINPWAVKFTSQDHSTYELTVCDWYPYGSYGFRDVPCACVNTLPLEDQDWAYVLALWPLGDKPFEFANVLMTTITHMDENPIYKWNEEEQKLELDTDVLKTNDVLCPFCQRGDGSMDFVIAEDWLKQYMGDAYTAYLSEYAWSEAGGNGTISRWINETGANGIERWQSYMLGLNPNNAESLPVLAVRTDTAPSVQKDGKTFVNVKVGGIAPRGYQYISPIYQVEELDPTTMQPFATAVKTDWQADPNFEVEVPVKSQAKDATPGHVKYFRVNVSFEGSDGMNNK